MNLGQLLHCETMNCQCGNQDVWMELSLKQWIFLRWLLQALDHDMLLVIHGCQCVFFEVTSFQRFFFPSTIVQVDFQYLIHQFVSHFSSIEFEFKSR
jgi:hypothetical protein